MRVKVYFTLCLVVSFAFAVFTVNVESGLARVIPGGVTRNASQNTYLNDDTFATSSSEIIWVPDNYTTIQSAINNATEGDTIALRAGTYLENVVVNKTITLSYELWLYTYGYGGPDVWNATIDGNKKGTVVLVTAPLVTVKGLIMRNSGTQTEDSGIRFENASNCFANGNILTNNSIGIFLGNSSDCTVSDNYANNNAEDGIRTELCGNCTLMSNQACNNGLCGFRLVSSHDCRMSFGTVANNNEVGILLTNCSRCGAYGDDVSNNRESGIRFDYSQDCSIAGKMNNNTYGISSSYSKGCSIYGEANYDTYGIWLSHSQGCDVQDAHVSYCEYGICFDDCEGCQIINENLVSCNRKYGIWLNYSESCFIGGENNISGNEYGIRVGYSRYCQIRVNEVDNNEYGIWIGDSEDCSIQATVFDGGNAKADNNTICGIYLNSSKNCLVQGYSLNEFEGSTGFGGIILLYSEDCVVTGNLVRNIGIGEGDEIGGCRLYQCENCTVQRNSFDSIQGEGISVKYSVGSKLFGNQISNSLGGNSLGGIWLYDSDNSIISGNDLGNNEYWGLDLVSSNCTVSENRIYDNNYVGIYLEGDQNTFYHNVFFNNTRDIENAWVNETIGGYNTWDDGHEGNYWDDYKGFDTDNDRIGETPYIIDGKNIDFYPLIGSPSEDHRPPAISSCAVLNALPSASNILKVNPLDVMKIQAQVTDQQTGVRQVTLYYGVGDLLNYSVGMVKTAGDWFNGTYEGWICPWIFLYGSSWNGGSTGVNITFRVEATDYPNNVGTSENMTFSTAEQRNALDIDITIYKVNTQDELSVDLNFVLDGYLPGWMGDPIYLEVDNWREDTRTDTAKLSMSPALLNGRSTLNYQGTLSQKFTLIGKSESYPFDSYYLNLTFRLHPSLPSYLSDQYWANVYSDDFGTLEEYFYMWTNVTLSTKLPHYVLPGLVSTWGDPEANVGYVSGFYEEATGFNVDFVLERQLNNELPLLLLIVSVTYMLGATLLEDARWKPEVKTAVYLSFFVMVAGFNFALRYMIPFRYGLTVAEVLFITLTVATAIFSIGLIISNIMHGRFSQKRARLANLVLDFSAVCISGVLLAIFLVPTLLLAIEVVGLSFGFIIRMAFIDRSNAR